MYSFDGQNKRSQIIEEMVQILKTKKSSSKHSESQNSMMNLVRDYGVGLVVGLVYVSWLIWLSSGEYLMGVDQ